MYRNFIKPLGDLFAALFGLAITSPVWILTAIALTIANRGSAFFVQPRPGKNGRIFRLVKFKTMTDERDANGELLPDEDRLTKVGTFVRKSSIDELPQLFNILMGNMSLVGPRPLLVEYLPLYNEEQARRHEVKGGITGWAQVNGRNAISWEQKFKYDVYYVDHQSFWLDMRILFMTVANVLKREGISSGTSATMEKFKGSEL
ncbi:sugar transferase [Fulvivirga sp. 1062]|uniref:Sugar transferase n=1 Tax=Fulvivirga sedimenti TaxID=2879465 RepID=A0A9X1KWN4_9BACT|nr:sugar transferase [Fulvivirga sedimenti]